MSETKDLVPGQKYAVLIKPTPPKRQRRRLVGVFLSRNALDADELSFSLRPEFGTTTISECDIIVFAAVDNAEKCGVKVVRYGIQL